MGTSDGVLEAPGIIKSLPVGVDSVQEGGKAIVEQLEYGRSDVSEKVMSSNGYMYASLGDA